MQQSYPDTTLIRDTILTVRIQDWKLFAEALWELQCVKKECPLTPELSLALHDVSYGITDLAIRIYMAAQVRAIETGFEKITEDLLRSAYRDDFRLVGRILEVLKSGDISPLHNLQDVFPPALQPIHQVAVESEGDSIPEESTTANPRTDGQAGSGKQNAAQQGQSAPAARKQATSGKDNIGITPPGRPKPSRKKVPAVYEEGDLRGVVERGKQTSPPQSPYAALLQAGYIRSAKEYVQE